MTISDMDRVILTDADGVLLNWEYGVDRWLTRHGYKRVLDVEADYSIAAKYGLSLNEKKKLCRMFNESAAIAFLPPFRDSIKYVRKLHEEHGFVFHCITSLSTDPNAGALRIQNLNRHFGEGVFERFVFLDTGADKDEILAEYKDSGLLWVEDKLENAVSGLKVGLDSVLLKHDHNDVRSNRSADDPVWEEGMDIPRFSNWKEIYEYVVGE